MSFDRIAHTRIIAYIINIQKIWSSLKMIHQRRVLSHGGREEINDIRSRKARQNSVVKSIAANIMIDPN